MVVFGGTSENGLVQEDMLIFNYNEYEWFKIKFSGGFSNFFYQGAAVSVMKTRKNL